MTIAQSLLDSLRSQVLAYKDRCGYSWAFVRHCLDNGVVIEITVTDSDVVYAFTNGRVYLTADTYSQASKLAALAMAA